MVFWEFDISNHNFHILTLSSYSYLLFFNLLFWTSSFVIFFKYNFNWTGYALINLTILVFFWFKDIILEGLGGFHNFYVQDGFKYGIILFIFREFIFFLSIFWVFFDTSINPSLDIGSFWPPYGLLVINCFGIPFLNNLFDINFRFFSFNYFFF